MPNSTRVNRGGYVLKDLVKIGTANNFSDVVIVHETRGEPDGLIVCSKFGQYNNKNLPNSLKFAKVGS